MDQLNGETPFVRFVAEALEGDAFVLIDVGAANGIATAWRAFGDELQGLGFDPDTQEVERLNRIEPAPQFRYVAGYVGLPPDHSFARRRAGKPRLERNPWDRLAVQRWSNIRSAADSGAPIPACPARPIPLFQSAERSEEYSPIVHLPDVLQSTGIASVDFIKIDVDGLDFDVAQSMADWYRQFAVLGVGIEVNFFGSDSETGNTFHNIDRFFKGQSFELFDLRMRRYPTQDLPGRGVVGHPHPGDSAFGRPLQGDAFYARDVCAPWTQDFAKNLTGKKLAKSAALFAMFGLSDCAAEVLMTFRDRLAANLDVDRGLDLLAARGQAANTPALSYRDFITTFEQETYNERAK